MVQNGDEPEQNSELKQSMYQNTTTMSVEAQKIDCTCGQYYGFVTTNVDGTSGNGECDSLGIERSSISSPNNGAASMDASFVHLPPSLLVREEETPTHASKICYRDIKAPSSGFLQRYKHIKLLELAANSPQDPPRLCIDCVQR